MEKIKMTTPLVEMDGDEMTRILWQMIKDELILPFVELKSEYYDLGLPNRDATGDQVTMDAALANKKYGVSVKCATITPNAQRMTEYNLHEMWKSPNGTIRAVLDGTVFRAPILINCIKPVVKNWKKPITIARHAYGDVYKGTEFRIPGPGKAELVFTGEDGTEMRQTVYDFECPGVLQGQYNKDTSIASFARSCFNYALSTKQDLWFATKDTISKKYDHTFKDIFAEIYEAEYKEKFEAAGIEYFYTLIDDAVARVIRSEGGFIWACKNYDGDVHLGLQELRRRRDERHGLHRLWQPCHDDQRAGEPRRLLRVRGRPRHRHPPLLPLPEGRGDQHQPHGHHLRLDRRAGKARRAGRHPGPGGLCQKAGGRLHRHPGERRDDQGPVRSGGGHHPHAGVQRGVHQGHPQEPGRKAGRLNAAEAERRRPGPVHGARPKTNGGTPCTENTENSGPRGNFPRGPLCVYSCIFLRWASRRRRSARGSAPRQMAAPRATLTQAKEKP